MPSRPILPLVLCCLALAASAVHAADVGYRGWGPRIGASQDPDQLVAGIQWNFGEIVPNLRLQPSVEVGSGDDATTLTLTLPVHYRFSIDPDFTPYFGGGLLVGYLDPTGRGRRGESQVEIAPMVAGGVDWRLSGGGSLLLELNLLGGDAYDARLMLGWMLRSR